MLFRWNLLVSVALFAYAARAAGPDGTDEPRVNITPRNSLHSRPSAHRSTIKVDANMVLLPITVTDSKDQPVTDLPADSFRVLEANVEQKVVSFHREEGPASVGFVFDASSSMKDRMDRSIAAIRSFLDTLAKGDEFFLIRFNDHPQAVTGFTDNPDDILSNLSLIQPIGWTALNDAIYLGVQRMKHAKNSRRALFLLTDGGDNNSRYTETEIRRLVQESDVRIYSIGLFEHSSFLEKLGMDSGGRAFFAYKLDDLPHTIDELSSEFRNQYVLGYYPTATNNSDGKYHRVRVEVIKTLTHMPLNVFWRHGYYSPVE